MATLEELKKEYVKNLNLTKMELGNMDSRTKYAQEGVLNKAKQKLDKLRPQVMGMILNDSSTVYIQKGIDLSLPLAEITADKTNDNVFIIDFLGLERTLMKDAYNQKQVKGYPFNTNTLSKLNNALLKVRGFLGATYIPAIQAKQTDYRVLENEDAALVHLTEILAKNFNNDLKKMYLARQMNTFTDKGMVNNDKMIFFVVDLVGTGKGLDNITGKTVIITEADPIPANKTELQALLSSKMKSLKKS